MKKLDINTWNRKDHYEIFRKMELPYAGISANLDISKFYQIVKKNNLSFFKCILYAVCRTANEIEEFRYRILEDEVYIIDRVSPSFTLLNDDKTYSYCQSEYDIDFTKFYKELDEKMQSVINKVSVKYENRNDLIYATSIPWVSFTNLLHPVSVNGDSVPRFAIGKYYKDGEKMLLPFSLQIHHALMDGYHMGLYFESIQKLLDNFESVLTYQTL